MGSRWTEVSPSAYAHEREALQYLRAGLPIGRPEVVVVLQLQHEWEGAIADARRRCARQLDVEPGGAQDPWAPRALSATSILSSSTGGTLTAWPAAAAMACTKALLNCSCRCVMGTSSTACFPRTIALDTTGSLA